MKPEQDTSGTARSDATRLSGRGCYEISGTTVRPVTGPASPGDTVAGWGERHADLLAESAAVAQVRHTLTAEENGLWNAIDRELDTVRASLTRLTRKGP